MPARLNYLTASRNVFEAMVDLQKRVSNCGLETRLLHLVYLLVSRINGCAYCIDMHSIDLRADGETETRIDLVSVWDEVDIYNDRERGLCLGRGCNQGQRDARAGCGIRPRAAALQPRGAGQANLGDRYHQWLEPFRDFVPQRAGTLSPR